MDLNEIMSSDSFFLDVSKYKEKNFEDIRKFLADMEENNPLWEIEFTYDGNPKPAPRPRTSSRTIQTDKGARTVTRWYDPGEKDKKAIKDFVRGILPDDYDPIDAEAYIHIKTFKPPIKDFNMTEMFLAEAGILRPDKKPDVDNYAKTVMDAINGVVWIDDGRVVNLVVDKYYSVWPRVEVRITYRMHRLTKK